MEINTEDLVYTTPSILDTDLYKFTMQQAILDHFPETPALYKFTHRDQDVLFPRKCIDLFRESIQRFRDVRLTPEEKVWLANTCPFFSRDYIEYLSQFQFDPAQISTRFIPISEDGEHGKVEIEAKGLWIETILWEVPVMACLSELYFRVGVTDWSYDGQKEIAAEKARTLLEAGCTFSEFGTRRRRSFHVQDLLIATLKEEADRSQGPGVFFGTSNAYFAKKYDLHVIGTIAQCVLRLFYNPVAALKGYEGANVKALELWEETYKSDMLTALTDTFSTRVFFQDFAKHPERARKWTSLRQDSGNPFDFAPAAKAMYDNIGIDISTKSIIYSDSLNVDKAVRLKAQCDEIGTKCSFGIGTFLTNDFKTKSSGYKEKSRALNMVIKLSKVDNKDCVKISDDLTKNTGEKTSVEYVKKLYGLSI
ncbi:Quinolinate phosphoribosyl transferase [Chiua virens]|nr:Quinolinate phosphoribosyl transferase [Chiua virens]